MTESPSYVIAGRGRWAARMKAILEGEGHRTTTLPDSRRAAAEDESSYRQRLYSSFSNSNAQIVWLCIPPGNHIPVVMEAAIQAGLHIVVEKPWFCSPEETGLLEALAKPRHLLLAIHYEYCLIEQVETWRREWHGGGGLQFHGRMKVNRPSNTGLPALENLGSHLFSIHEYSVPDSQIVEMECGYEQTDERRVWLAKKDHVVTEIDLLANKEPIIQRFIARVEAAIRGEHFPFDLQFALRIAERISLWRQRSRL
jgi:Oxidoreductase family, NAD-binding Rossmann fold